ncbi:hypothetical protein E2C01_030601 [Portunus trituberculatus]|uniref:Uncharacterized protein n=1 Tax=Portunus trituberculatus TaxID=210409 RepID=A0A5B7EV84_PORTR|nr:hypothetical protein [Portunus trituberculatus]
MSLPPCLPPWYFARSSSASISWPHPAIPALQPSAAIRLFLPCHTSLLSPSFSSWSYPASSPLPYPSLCPALSSPFCLHVMVCPFLLLLIVHHSPARPPYHSLLKTFHNYALLLHI